MKANTVSNVLLVGIAAFVAVLLVAAALSNTPWYNTSILVSLLAGLVVSLLIPARWKIRLISVVLSYGFSLLALEIALEVGLFSPVEAGLAAARSQGIPFDERTRLEVLKDLEAAGVNAIVGPPHIYARSLMTIAGQQVLPLGWVANKPTVLCNESGKFVVYESDEHGFRNPKGLWEQANVDVVILGDSFATGYCVEDGKTLAGVIRNLYKNTMNLSVSGTGPLAQLAIVKEYGGDLKPANVVWFYSEGNDLLELQRELEVGILRQYLEDDLRQNLASIQDEIDRGIILSVKQARTKEDIGFWALSSLYERIQLDNLRHRIDGMVRGDSSVCGEFTKETFAKLDRVLRNANHYVASWGGTLYFVYLPTWARYAENVNNCRFASAEIRFRDRILSIAEGAGIPTIDVTQAFAQHPDPLSLWNFRIHGHYNAAGYKLATDTVLRAMRSSSKSDDEKGYRRDTTD